jgi:hypothetical protein
MLAKLPRYQQAYADAFIALGLPTEQNASEHPRLVVSALLEN